jgi:hypothetical protein
MAVSIASIWQKKSGLSRSARVQYASSRAVVPVTPTYPPRRHALRAV